MNGLYFSLVAVWVGPHIQPDGTWLDGVETLAIDEDEDEVENPLEDFSHDDDDHWEIIQSTADDNRGRAQNYP